MFFPLALPFKVCECDVFMAVLPVHTIAPCFHLVYEVLSACGCLSAVHNRQCYILHIALYLAFLGLLQEVVCLFIPRNSFFSFFSGECLSLFRNMKPLLPALLIAPVFQVLQIRFAPLQLVTILIIHAVHYEMAVNVSSVYVSGNKNFMPFPCFCVLCKLHSVPMGLLWCDMLVLILSRLVDTFFSRISPTMQLPPKHHSIAYVLPWAEGLHWQSRSSGCSNS